MRRKKYSIFLSTGMQNLHHWIFRTVTFLLIFVALTNSVSSQSKDRDFPTRLTSNVIEGQISFDRYGDNYHYEFVANPGELSIRVSVTSEELTFACVGFDLFDEDAKIIGDGLLGAGGNQTEQLVKRFRITRRQTLLLRIILPLHCARPKGKYRIQLSGNAVDVAPAKSKVEDFIKRGDEYADKGMWQEAENEYTQAIELEPSNSHYGFKLFFSIYRQGLGNNQGKTPEQLVLESKILRKIDINFQSVVSTLKQEVDKEPRRSFKYKELGYLLFMREPKGNSPEALVNPPNFEKSIEAFKMALKLNPNDPEPNLYLGIIANIIGDKVNSCKHFQESCRLGGNVACKFSKEDCVMRLK